MGPGTTDDDAVSDNICPTVDDTCNDNICHNEVNEVRFLTADFFQKKLVHRFDILFSQFKIKWPKQKHSIHGPPL